MGLLEDIKITDKIAVGDKEAFKELFDLYYKPLCVYAIKFIDSFEDAEDVVQSLFASFWIRYSKKQFTGSLRAYLFSAVRNNCIKLSNSARTQSLDDTDYIQEADDVFLFLENAEKDYNLLYKEIDKLPPQCRKVFDAVIIENMRYKDAAGLLGISVNTVKTQLSRALRQLRESLELVIFSFLM